MSYSPVECCRLCLYEGNNLIDLFIENNETFTTNIKRTEKILEFTTISINYFDELPKTICVDCNTTVKYFEEFKSKCLTSDSVLKNRIKNLVEIKDVDPVSNFADIKLESFDIDEELSPIEHGNQQAEDEISSRDIEKYILPDAVVKEYNKDIDSNIYTKELEQQSKNLFNTNNVISETPLDIKLEPQDVSSHLLAELSKKLCSTKDVSEVPPKIKLEPEDTSSNLIPETSKKYYNMVYTAFMEWRLKKQIVSFSESIILMYFTELAEKYKPTTLWTTYSMLRSTLIVNHKIHIDKYHKVRALLKRKAEGFKPRKAGIFSADEITKFINDAPNSVYLVTKVVLIMGIIGGCRVQEIYLMNFEDLRDIGSAYLVNVFNKKTKTTRQFTIADNYYNICKAYIRLRPHMRRGDNWLFISYRDGKCSNQRIGINKISAMGRQIADFLKLSNRNAYSGHSFRRSSTKLLTKHSGSKKQ